MSISGQMTFKRFGRSLHLRIETAEDLRCAVELDEALWVASAVPTAGLNCDREFLRLVDSTGNGRIVCDDLKVAISWAFGNLRDPAGIAEASTTLRLDAIDDEGDEGPRIAQSARKILGRMGLADADEITLDQVRQIKASVEAAPVSEAGVILPAAAAQDDIRQFIVDVISSVGGAEHPSGKAGVGQAQLDQFVAKAKAQLAWYERGLIGEDADTTEIKPLGAKTAEAFAAMLGLREKIDEYFVQCEAVLFDVLESDQLLAPDAAGQRFQQADRQALEGLLAELPLARPRADCVLSFTDQINPVYVEHVERFRQLVAGPILGADDVTLSMSQWKQVKGFFAAHEAWLNDKPAPELEYLGPDKLRRYLDHGFAARVGELISASGEAALALGNIRLTEQLILYQANLLALANNFVSFPHLYDPRRRAMFETGTLIMDGRRFSFSLKVADRREHARLAKTSNIFVLYAEVTPADGSEKFDVAIPVTAGGKGNLVTGKRGVFEDLASNQYDARVVQIIENPISLTEALASPFQRLGRLLSGKIEAMAAAAEKKLDTRAGAAVEQVRAAGEAGPARRDNGLLAGGLLMGGGVAIAALGSALAYITKTLAGVALWKIGVGVAMAILAVMLPTTIVAIIKLRRRDLSAILEGAGWAINARMCLTRRQSRLFSRGPRYPSLAKGARRKKTWLVVLLLALLASGAVGWGVNWLRCRAPQAQPASTQSATSNCGQP